ncbi:1,4-beta-xylanase [Alkalilimnicola ehrlichii]|uniref:Beta-xylanase n=1 Tax=Alkalilimnicola ehrlichii TaxID=351052 RepID=A0A3E0WLS7_9GAMM|nr:endo-1,4-beta-xylanase [Alkalilimnicola ehrlichii]RFA26570.1 1,4-beta-xylanase [Alkalilimnicola ehrlichii]RFA32926.1 1,4-beta-xylanase [Alkalilimnicola ehrlichii]
MPLSRRRFLQASVALAALSQLKGVAMARALEISGLKEVFRDDFLIGTAISNRTLETQDRELLDIISSEFNAITAENCMKSGEIQPAQGQWDWTLADRFIEFGREQGMTVVGHAPVWHSQTPDDLFVDSSGHTISRDTLKQRMETHITTLMERYRDQVAIWDVVNEAIDEDQGWRRSPWYEIFGDASYMEHAFHLAHELDPAAHLLYNDYNMHNPGKRAFLVDVLRDYRRRGVPIHGVGLQGHVGLDFPDLDEFERSIEAYAAQGMRIHITEFEVDVLPVAWEYTGADIATDFEYADELDPYTDGLPADVEEKLTARYVEMFELFLRHRDKIDRVSTWGTYDAESWKNDFPVIGRTNYPLLFDRDRRRKPAYHAVAELRR